MQSHQEKRTYQSNLRESETQTETGLIQFLSYLCEWGNMRIFNELKPAKLCAAAVERLVGLFTLLS